MYFKAFKMLHTASVHCKYIIIQKKNRDGVPTPNIVESDLKNKITDSVFKFKILLESYSTQELKNLNSQESAHEFHGKSLELAPVICTALC